MNNRWPTTSYQTIHPLNLSVAFTLIISFVLVGLCGATTWFVQPGAGGAGTGWGNPTSLQQAINAASAGDTIWVAKGTHQPNQTFGGMSNQHKTFYINKSLYLYGGFSGGETDLSERNWRKQETILDGYTMPDTAYHVVYLDGTTNDISDLLLDGFTIRNGRAIGPGYPFDSGAGIFLDCPGTTCTPTIQHCNIQNNRASQWGGGMLLVGSTSGGNCSPTIMSCTFRGNEAILGGAILSDDFDAKTTVAITNCEFIANHGISSGGALCFFGQNGPPSMPRIFACTFTNNTSPDGGAVKLFSESDDDFQLQIESSILWNNGDEISSTELDVFLLFSVLDDGTPDGNISMSGVVDFLSNLDSDPLFVDISSENFQLTPGSPAIDAGWTSMVPATLTTDILGKPRIKNTTIDMGAYENHCPNPETPIHVDLDAHGTNTGASWVDAIPDLQEALDHACACDTGSVLSVWVAEGTYYPTRTQGALDESYNTFYIDKDLRIFGGFNGSENDLNDRTLKYHKTVLSGDLGVPDNYSDNARAVMTIDGREGGLTSGDFLLDGFEMTNTGRSDGVGVGISIETNITPITKVRIANCDFHDHQSQASRGLAIIRNLGSDLSIYNSLFYDNSAGIGAVLENIGNLDIRNSTFYNNMSPNGTLFIRDPTNSKSSSISNSILWNSSNIFHADGRTTTLTNSNYDDGNQNGTISFSGGLQDGGGNIESDPLFVNITNDNYRLAQNSPSVGTGSNALVPASITRDLDGLDRQTGLVVDMGPYENPYQYCNAPSIIDHTYGPLDGYYFSDTPIILGKNTLIESGAQVTLAAPLITLEENVDIALGAELTFIIGGTCD